MQAAELLVLVGVVAAFYWALTPVRRRLTAAIARLLGHKERRPGTVVALARRSDGIYEHEEKQ